MKWTKLFIDNENKRIDLQINEFMDEKISQYRNDVSRWRYTIDEIIKLDAKQLLVIFDVEYV